MTKEKQVTLKIDVRSAAAVRQVLFEHQKGHSYEFASERITDIRKVIQELDNKIGEVVTE
jgi:hypothetical protein